jgi:hypothetical protein
MVESPVGITRILGNARALLVIRFVRNLPAGLLLTLSAAAGVFALESGVALSQERLPPLSTLAPLDSSTELNGALGIEPLPDAVPPDGPAPGQDYFDLDAYLAGHAGPRTPCEGWCWQILPNGLIYKPYLADLKESRLGTQFFNLEGQGSVWDTNLGGRMGILRYGTVDGPWPQGWQIDLEGSGQVRLDTQEDRDLQSADFRVGSYLSYGYGPSRWKFGYYHISAHLGDEFLVANPDCDRINWVRDTFVLGYSYYWTDNLRLYSEVGWAFYTDYAEPWELRFGAEYAPARATGIRGAPFAAIHGHLMQEHDFGGNLTVQAGWAWRGDRTSHLFRTGLHYYNGKSNQYSFYDQFEQQIGAGVWYDF